MPSRRRTRAAWLALPTVLVVIGGCGEELDRTPEKIDGTESTEFEEADIERAEDASEAVQEYCSGAASEAQRIGCLSHVDESEIP